VIADASAAATDRPRVSNLKMRIFSALMLLPVALAALWWGGLVFTLGAGFVWLLVLVEWTKVTGGSGFFLVDVGAAVGFAAGLILLGFDFQLAALAVGAATLIMVCVAAIVRRSALWLIAGLAYCVIPVCALIGLRSHPQLGLPAVMLVFLCVWMTDIAAYFSGRLIGGPKLWPSVSPKKTWAGAIGGLAAGTLAGLVIAFAFGLQSIAAIVVLSAGLSVASQCGDLIESALKRRFGVKDAGHVIPGHGGFMDRVDGLATASVAAIIVALVRGSEFDLAAGLLIW
jgi:phosphatidate cytidylyltransferase